MDALLFLLEKIVVCLGYIHEISLIAKSIVHLLAYTAQHGTTLFECSQMAYKCCEPFLADFFVSVGKICVICTLANPFVFPKPPILGEAKPLAHHMNARILHLIIGLVHYS